MLYSKLGWKVPFRQCYTDTFVGWVKLTIWCHFVIKVFPNAYDFGSASLLDECIKDPFFFHEQYRGFLRRAKRYQDAYPNKPPRDEDLTPLTAD